MIERESLGGVALLCVGYGIMLATAAWVLDAEGLLATIRFAAVGTFGLAAWVVVAKVLLEEPEGSR